jgi:hypothetical protein
MRSLVCVCVFALCIASPLLAQQTPWDQMLTAKQAADDARSSKCMPASDNAFMWSMQTEFAASEYWGYEGSEQWSRVLADHYDGKAFAMQIHPNGVSGNFKHAYANARYDIAVNSRQFYLNTFGTSEAQGHFDKAMLEFASAKNNYEWATDDYDAWADAALIVYNQIMDAVCDLIDSEE